MAPEGEGRTPALGPGHVPRAALLQRLGAALERRFVLLQAPAGFGKTTVLADFSRRKREEGLVVAWVSLDAGDVPSAFGGYLACAFERGGLDLPAPSDPEARPASPETYEVGILASAVELHEAPCLLVLDEVDRLPRETVELVQRLVEHGPGNLDFALAFRSDPGLDLSMQVLDGAGGVFGAEELRFSRSEMKQFFGDTLSRRPGQPRVGRQEQGREAAQGQRVPAADPVRGRARGGAHARRAVRAVQAARGEAARYGQGGRSDSAQDPAHRVRDAA